ncbi:XK-related protein 6 [Lamellibrachia satsuma]|nr:XK-related protein 6 [Lamellibrachia satsuma]
MGAGEKVASSNKGVVKIGDPCDFSSTPLKQGTNNKQWLAETRKNFSGTDLILVIVSLITYVLDTVTDILVGAKYIEDGEYIFGGLALSCIVVSSIVIQLFSSQWYSRDGKPTGCQHWFIHVFLLQPIERYLLVLVAGMQAHYSKTTENIDNYFYQQNDLCILRLFEAFLESAPQLTLQLYIIMCTQTAGWLTATSACVSLIAMGWAVVAYSHALRHAYCDDYHVYWPGLLLQTVWHVTVVASRVIAIVAFTATFSAWILLCLGGHWLLMTIWVTLQKTDFGASWCERVLFVSVVGTIYCFSFFNLKEGSTRWRVLAFYSLMLVENTALVAAWYCYRVPGAWYDDSVVPVVSTTFLIGIAGLTGWFTAIGVCTGIGGLSSSASTAVPVDSSTTGTSTAPGTMMMSEALIWSLCLCHTVPSSTSTAYDLVPFFSCMVPGTHL